MISFSPLITFKPKTVPLTAMTELFEDRKNSSSSWSLFCTSASTIPSSTKIFVLYLSLPSDLILIFVFSPKNIFFYFLEFLNIAFIFAFTPLFSPAPFSKGTDEFLKKVFGALSDAIYCVFAFI